MKKVILAKFDGNVKVTLEQHAHDVEKELINNYSKLFNKK